MVVPWEPGCCTGRGLLKFLQKTFTGPTMPFSIAGILTLPDPKELIDVYSKDIPRRKHSACKFPQEPTITHEVRDTVYDNGRCQRSTFTPTTFGARHEGFYAVKCWACSTGQEKAAACKRSLWMSSRKPFAVLSARLEDPELHRYFRIANLGVDLGDLEKSMDAVISDVRQNLISAEEFQKLQNQVENDFISANNRVAGIAESLANYADTYIRSV
ncbi:MAG: hypothetical protein R2778_02220 [Saprospiraceae bacterium]